MPILALVILGIFDLGWAIYANNTVSSAAREGARRAIIKTNTDNDAAIKQHVKDSAQGLGLTNAQITIAPVFSSRNFGDPITVTVTYTYTPLTPVIGNIVAGSGLGFKATSSMILEGVIPY
ncbi:MAG: pilus assembly protein [Chloroflexi bacterium]|nr:pilus assembly protein [Chloroflexota bacterium]